MFTKSLLVFLVVCSISCYAYGQEAQLSFRKDYTYIEAVKSYYKIHTTKRTWAGAKRECALEGATFWHPENDVEAQAVLSFWKTNQPQIPYIYTALSSIIKHGQLETIDGKTFSEVYNRGLTQPHNGAPYCVYIYQNTNMGNEPCDYQYNFICKKSIQLLEWVDRCNMSVPDGKRGQISFREDYTYLEPVKSLYKIHTTKRNWAGAKRECALEGATFWHPENDDEAQAVLSFWKTSQPQIPYIYTALSSIIKHGQLETIDGKTVSEVYNRGLAQPPSSAPYCVYIYQNTNMGNEPCDYNYHFICKKSLQLLEWVDSCSRHVPGVKQAQISFGKDYTYIKAVKSFYKIHTESRTWAGAKRACALEGATFWHPDNEDEAKEVLLFWKTSQPQIPYIYTALSSIITKGKLETIDGKTVSEVFNRGLAQPPSGAPYCVYIYQNTNMGNEPCDYHYNFICKKSIQLLEWVDHCNVSVPAGTRTQITFREDYTYLEHVKSFYKIHTQLRNWAGAKRECALEGATFWHPENDDESQAVLSFWKTNQPQIPYIYTALSSIITNGQLETIDGKTVSEVFNRGLAQPPASAPYCVYIYQSSSMGNEPCNYQYNFICKKSIQSLELDYDCNISNSAQHFFRKDYNYIETVENFYKIHTTPRTWAEAKQVCALEGASFWHPDNDTEALAVTSFWKTTQSHLDRVYVGLSDKMAKGLFETIDGKSVFDVYNTWQPGQPDDKGGKQDCVHIFQNGSLDDCECDDKYSFICKKSLQSLEWNNRCNVPDLDYTLNEDNVKCYKLHTTPMSWIDAYAVCRLEQSNLAVISSRQEADYLVKLTESTPKPTVIENYQTEIYHVGFHNRFREGWQTVKGTPMDVDADAWWDNYQLADDRAQCGSMLHTGRLININCVDVKSFFICEREGLSDTSGQEENFM